MWTRFANHHKTKRVDLLNRKTARILIAPGPPHLRRNAPIAFLADIQNHFMTAHNTKNSKSNFSRRLQETGYQRSIIGRGHTSTEKRILPDISPEDWERLLRDPAAKEAMTAGWGTVYAWLKSSVPVRRKITEAQRAKRKPRSQENGIEEKDVVVGDESLDESDVRDASPGNDVENGDAPAAQLPSAYPPSGGTTVHPQLPSFQTLLAPSVGPVGQPTTRT